MFTINGEQFVEIKNHPQYAIGNNGTVLSKKSTKGKEWRKMTPYKGRTSKYLCISLFEKEKQYKCLIHRLVALHFVEGYFTGAVVNHKDSNIYNNNYMNLEWTTQKENIHQSYEHSGVGATRNYKIYRLYYKDEPVSPEIIGVPAVIRYAVEHNFDISPSSLNRYHISRNYKIKQV